MIFVTWVSLIGAILAISRGVSWLVHAERRAEIAWTYPLGTITPLIATIPGVASLIAAVFLGLGSSTFMLGGLLAAAACLAVIIGARRVTKAGSRGWAVAMVGIALAAFMVSLVMIVGQEIGRAPLASTASVLALLVLHTGSVTNALLGLARASTVSPSSTKVVPAALPLGMRPLPEPAVRESPPSPPVVQADAYPPAEPLPPTAPLPPAAPRHFEP